MSGMTAFIARTPKGVTLVCYSADTGVSISLPLSTEGAHALELALHGDCDCACHRHGAGWAAEVPS